jgi:hypothetical protein
MTICAVKQANYLLARIRGEVDALSIKALALTTDQQKLALQMICRLDWRDFCRAHHVVDVGIFLLSGHCLIRAGASLFQSGN